MSADNGLKLQSWVILHPYTTLFLFFAIIVCMYIMFLPKVYRKANEGNQGKRSLPRILIYFCIANVLAIVILIISCFRGH
jgi:hypothetical protein